MGCDFEFKYVMINNIPIVFFQQQHKSMEVHGQITSAAFFKFIDGKVKVYGHSTSMKMGPAPDDETLLNIFFGTDK